MSGVLQTLLHVAEVDTNTLFLNAQAHAVLSSDVVCQQYFRPYYTALQNSGFHVTDALPEEDITFDAVWILAPKNAIEAQYFIAKGSLFLNTGGTLYVAADNKAGGSRLKKWMQTIGFDNVQTDARNKARVCWAVKEDLTIEGAIKSGEQQRILGDRFLSQPGVYGWNKLDKGSDVLTQHLPQDLKGRGADFGCGYGYLSDFLLRSCPKIKTLYCLDADARAVSLCKHNLSDFVAEKEFLWTDLTQEQTSLRNLDFIVMNPPFHEGKSQDIQVGCDFIKVAHSSLRRNGALWMVANAHLPYEKILDETFFKVTKVHEMSGFKVFHASK